MPKQTKPSPVQLAARIYGCRVDELLSYREYEDGSVVIIAPSGQKFTYSAHSIMEYALRSAEGPRSSTLPPTSAAPYTAAPETREEQLLIGSSISAVPQDFPTDPLVVAAVEEIGGEAGPEPENTVIKSEQPAEQLSCFPASLDGPRPASKKKRTPAEHSKTKDAK